MKRFVLLAIFVIVQGITGFPQKPTYRWHYPLWHSDYSEDDDPSYSINYSDDSDDLVLLKSKGKISDKEIKTEIKSPVHEDFPKLANVNNSVVNTDTLDNKNEKSVPALPLLDTIYHQLNNILHSLREFTEAACVMKDLITKNQSTSANTESNNEIHEYVISTIPNEHVDLINDQFILNKKLKPEEDNIEDKENLEDNKEKLEDNKNLVTSESTISESIASAAKKNENSIFQIPFSFYDLPSEETVFREDYEKEKPDSEDISKSTSDDIIV